MIMDNEWEATNARIIDPTKIVLFEAARLTEILGIHELGKVGRRYTTYR